MADYGDAKQAMEINPGTRSVTGPSEDLAATALDVFMGDLGELEVVVEQAIRLPELDTPADAGRRGGRYAWRLDLPEGRSAVVLMPGAPLDAIRARTTHAPCMIVDGEDWWWTAALGDVASTARGARSSQDPLLGAASELTYQ